MEQVTRHRVIPVLRLESLNSAEPLFESLQQGGLPIAEITLRTDCAIDAIRIARKRSGFTVGAGTVLNVTQCEQVLDAGASFVVSPGFDRGVVEFCLDRGVPCLPGFATATELQNLFNLGIRTAKFFPAESLGGVSMLRALSGPFHQMKFVPTGGIDLSNLKSWLSLPCVPAVGGSWMVSSTSRDQNEPYDFQKIIDAVRKAVRIAGSETGTP